MQQTQTHLNVCFAIVLVAMSFVLADADISPEENMDWLDNGQVRLGANLDIGGSITYLADANNKANLINSFDWGRQIQMSFYSGPNPFIPEGKQVREGWKSLGWNPIQSGDCFGHRSTVVEHSNDGVTLYVKCIPMHWPLNNVPGQCTFECWYTLDGRTVKVHSRLNNHRDDKTQYPGHSQELPAIYTNAPWHKLMTYTGDKPFTGDRLAEIPKQQHPPGGIIWARWFATENWAAMVNEDNVGLGVWHPEIYTFIGGFAGIPGKGGPDDSPTGYISPIRRAILDWNIQYDYHYILIVDTLDNIRKYVYDNAAPVGKPDFTFTTDRQHWTYVNAVDGGLPVSDAVTVTPTDEYPIQLISPDFFCKAAPEQKLLLTAAIETSKKQKSVQGRLYWKTFAHNNFTAENSMAIELPADGTFQTTAIAIGSAKGYNGIITGLRINPFSFCTKKDSIKLQHIRIE